MRPIVAKSLGNNVYEQYPTVKPVCDRKRQDVQLMIMQVELPDNTVRDVEAMLAKRGENGNVSEFIDRTLQRALFFETVRDIKRQNAGADPQEFNRLIDEAVAAVRAERCRSNPDANGV
jgi:Arc/MetJ-type ribon-helix-helix transcriptional regulator